VRAGATDGTAGDDGGRGPAGAAAGAAADGGGRTGAVAGATIGAARLTETGGAVTAGTAPAVGVVGMRVGVVGWTGVTWGAVMVGRRGPAGVT
jgi:hypothetical protein